MILLHAFITNSQLQCGELHTLDDSDWMSRRGEAGVTMERSFSARSCVEVTRTNIPERRLPEKDKTGEREWYGETDTGRGY
jgi:hypothetical protein